MHKNRTEEGHTHWNYCPAVDRLVTVLCMWSVLSTRTGTGIGHLHRYRVVSVASTSETTLEVTKIVAVRNWIHRRVDLQDDALESADEYPMYGGAPRYGYPHLSSAILLRTHSLPTRCWSTFPSPCKPCKLQFANFTNIDIPEDTCTKLHSSSVSPTSSPISDDAAGGELRTGCNWLKEEFPAFGSDQFS